MNLKLNFVYLVPYQKILNYHPLLKKKQKRTKFETLEEKVIL